MAWLALETLELLCNVAVGAGLAQGSTLDALVAGLDPRYVAGLPRGTRPLDQLWLTITKMNHDGHLEDGTLPLVHWLKVAAFMTRPLAGTSDVFTEAYEKLSALTSGNTPPPTPLVGVTPTAIRSRLRLRELQTLIDTRTRRFVGREFLFEELEKRLRHPEGPSGYVVIEGEPGIGKTAFSAKLVSRRGLTPAFHFNQRGNVVKAHDFIANMCAQLIVRYGLRHGDLPSDATENNLFLSRVLSEAAVVHRAKEPSMPLLLLVDALDEAIDEPEHGSANRLLLPMSLPDGVFVVITSRPSERPRLHVDRCEFIELSDRDPRNLADIHAYVVAFMDEFRHPMAERLAQWKVSREQFIEIVTERSDGNFMYTEHVLDDFRTGELTEDKLDRIERLPRGLRSYYAFHWEAMQRRHEAFDRVDKPILCKLAAAREPVGVAQLEKWLKLRDATVSTDTIVDALRRWRPFLNIRGESHELPRKALYSLYHASFQDYLREEIGLVDHEDDIIEAALRDVQWRRRKS